MADHIRIRIIHDDEIKNAGFNSSNQPVRYFGRRHFRLHVIGRHFGRRNQNTFFTRKLRFLPTIEEKRHMRIFFRFSDTQLLLSGIGNHLPHHIADGLCREQYIQ